MILESFARCFTFQADRNSLQANPSCIPIHVIYHQRIHLDTMNVNAL
jgi:hypothetical protein